MQKRFNKTNVLNHIFKQIHELETQWGFTSNNGYAQVEGAEFEKVMAYGKYESLNNLYDSILYVDLRG